MDAGGYGVEEDGVTGYADRGADYWREEARFVFVGEGGAYGVYYCTPYTHCIVFSVKR